MYNIKEDIAIHYSFYQTLYALLQMLRPRQWIKNLFLMGAIVFSFSLNNTLLLIKATEGFFVFCLLSSSVYILNDIVDIENDKIHPEKRLRPIASGKISRHLAVTALFLITVISFSFAYFLGKSFFMVSLVYFLTSNCYSLLLKKIVILDVLMIAFGFVLRAYAGAVVIGVEVSVWLLLCTFLLALFIGFNKRRYEIILLDKDALSHRKTLDEYNIELVNHMISVSSSCTLMAYCLYTFNSIHSQNLMITIPFVVYGLFRFQYLSSKKNMGGSADAVLTKDLPMVVNIILWVLTCIIILYVW